MDEARFASLPKVALDSEGPSSLSDNYEKALQFGITSEVPAFLRSG